MLELDEFHVRSLAQRSQNRGGYNPPVTLVDLIVVAWVVVSAVQGARRGLVVNGLGLIGFIAGAVVGSRIAPHLLAQGSQSPWVPAASMIAALVVGLAAQTLAGAAAGAIRRRIPLGPLAAIDTAGGMALGGVLGLALVWLAAVVAVQQPSLGLRRDVQQSTILPVLLRAVPATTVLDALARFDPLPILPPALADRALSAPDAAVLHTPGVHRAEASVVKIVGESCGIGIQGSGWVVRPGLVVTNAHVVAGESGGETVITPGPTPAFFHGTVVAVDSSNDVALIRVPRLALRPVLMASGVTENGRVALVGYPEGHGLTPVPGRIGRVIDVLGPDAYGSHVHLRPVVPLRGLLRHGDSGGPVLTPAGRVAAVMFAADQSGSGGYGVPLSAVKALLAGPLGHANVGPCAG
jgi:uncharacterized membrane protein required for colicin V production